MFLDILVRLCSNTTCAAADCGGTPQRTTGRFATRGPRQPRETEKGERPPSRGRLRRPLEQFVGRLRLRTPRAGRGPQGRERPRRVQALIGVSSTDPGARTARREVWTWSWRGQGDKGTHDTGKEERPSDTGGVTDRGFDSERRRGTARVCARSHAQRRNQRRSRCRLLPKRREGHEDTGDDGVGL